MESQESNVNESKFKKFGKYAIVFILLIIMDIAIFLGISKIIDTNLIKKSEYSMDKATGVIQLTDENIESVISQDNIGMLKTIILIAIIYGSYGIAIFVISKMNKGKTFIYPRNFRGKKAVIYHVALAGVVFIIFMYVILVNKDWSVSVATVRDKGEARNSGRLYHYIEVENKERGSTPYNEYKDIEVNDKVYIVRSERNRKIIGVYSTKKYKYIGEKLNK